tara:strand:+ start:1885 stop:2025 length:141 start_codon:yes stop_codon:yes gene_type:complete
MELSSGESNYIGNAKDPSTLIEPDDEALENLAELLEEAGLSIPGEK